MKCWSGAFYRAVFVYFRVFLFEFASTGQQTDVHVGTVCSRVLLYGSHHTRGGVYRWLLVWHSPGHATDIRIMYHAVPYGTVVAMQQGP